MFFGYIVTKIFSKVHLDITTINITTTSTTIFKILLIIPRSLIQRSTKCRLYALMMSNVLFFCQTCVVLSQDLPEFAARARCPVIKWLLSVDGDDLVSRYSIFCGFRETRKNKLVRTS